MKALLLKLIRNGLGRLIIFIDFLTRPKKMQRSEQLQQQVNEQAQTMSLYQFHACPFCVKVRRAMRRLNVDIELHDAKNDPVRREELNTGGGRIKVPCLKTNDGDKETWLYESKDIIAYLEKQFAAPAK